MDRQWIWHAELHHVVDQAGCVTTRSGHIVAKPDARRLLTDLCRLVHSGGLFAATVTYGVKSRIVTDGWIPGRYIARWRKEEFARAARRAGWTILELRVVTNRERKGRWINVIARREWE